MKGNNLLFCYYASFALSCAGYIDNVYTPPYPEYIFDAKIIYNHNKIVCHEKILFNHCIGPDGLHADYG